MEPADRRSAEEQRVETRERERFDAAERDFFAHHYGEQTYHPTGWRLRMERDLRVLLRAAGPRGLGRVLSIGCGDGAFERLLAPHAESVLGVDLSPVAIEVAERLRTAERIDNLRFRCVSFRDLPDDQRYDTVVCLAFLHHVPEQELAGFLRACQERLEPGGLFFSQDPNVRGALRALGRVVLGRRYDAYHSAEERELDPDQLAAQLCGAGFASVAIRHVDLTLIPACYLLAGRAGWPLHVAAWADRAWCATPLARWSSGFAAIARRA